MDYEKKYKEALERAKELHGTVVAGRDFLAEIFPELTESEDERIRKVIHKILHAVRKDVFTAQDEIVTRDKALAYLERQKEQKPTQSTEEKEYVRTAKSIIADFIRDNQPEDVAYYQRIYDWLDGRHIEQKPAEWKPTEEQFNYLAKAIMTLGEEGDCKTAGVLSEIRKGLKCSFPDWKVSPDYPEEGCNVSLNGEVKKIQEWSEEDEKAFSAIEEAIGSYHSSNYACELVDWLKSLRPQPHWKPSEEQMEALESAVKLYKDTHYEMYHERIVSLYEHLKKLM